MNVNYRKGFGKLLQNWLQHYNAEKYWTRRDYVIRRGGIKLLKFYYLFYIKRCDAFNKASMGTDINHGAEFGSVPRLPHGLNGIIVSPDARIGKNCTIFHQVTIGNDYRDVHNVPMIGDNVIIYPGAKIVGKVKIGNNVEIGANSVVTRNVPDNSTVIVAQTRIVQKKEQKYEI